jgi:predicted RNA-binding protein YlxR (DUF448 family)
MKEKPQLLRIVSGPDGEVLPDPAGKAEGRGAYICPNSVCLDKARKHRGLERSFKRRLSDEVYIMVQRELDEARDQENI